MRRPILNHTKRGELVYEPLQRVRTQGIGIPLMVTLTEG